MNTGQVVGRVDAGTLGAIPHVHVAFPRPHLTNNGFGVYGGMPLVTVPDLAAALPDDGRPIRQGHVLVTFRDGSRFLTYAATTRGDDIYDFA